MYTRLRNDTLKYGVHGPIRLGYATWLLTAEAPLEITVWYPAVNDGNLEEAITYPYEIKMDDPFGTIALASFSWAGDEGCAF